MSAPDTSPFRPLTDHDLFRILAGVPPDLRELMRTHPALTLAGGAIRALVAGEPVSDYDFFMPLSVPADVVAETLRTRRIPTQPQTATFVTPNAITLLTPGRIPVQFITRWRFGLRADILASFDFTIAQACVWYEEPQPAAITEPHRSGGWRGLCTDAFYCDLAARRLVYTSPVCDEDACGSLLRMRKFLAKGYTIQADSLAKTVARAVMGAGLGIVKTEAEVAEFLTRVIREVDPLQIVDGVDVVDEHEIR